MINVRITTNPCIDGRYADTSDFRGCKTRKEIIEMTRVGDGDPGIPRPRAGTRGLTGGSVGVSHAIQKPQRGHVGQFRSESHSAWPIFP